jgi:curli biogenesis system outer membrane secretion channel CsgG
MKLFKITLLFLFFSKTMAATVAVTDLAYSNKVEGYIHTVDYHNDTKISASSRSRSSERAYAGAAADSYGAAAVAGYSGSSSSRSKFKASSNTDYHEYEHSYSYMEYGELRKFTGDIKGELIKSKNFQLVESKPAPIAKNELVYNIIARIKKGSFPNADYILFGRVSDMNFNESVYQAPNTNMNNQILGLTLVAEFSLINTKTYEVIAGFTATGEGSDLKIISPGTFAVPNRSLVIAQVSKSLGEDVLKQIEEQVFDKNSGQKDFDNRRNTVSEPIKPEGVTIFQ